MIKSQKFLKQVLTYLLFASYLAFKPLDLAKSYRFQRFFKKEFSKRTKYIGDQTSRYNNWVDKKPFKSMCISGGFLFVTGDVLAQTVFERKGFWRENEFDWVRTVRFTSIGTFLATPGLYGWYAKGMPYIEKMKSIKKIHKFPRTLLLTVLDQTAWEIPYTSAFQYSLNFFEFFDQQKAFSNQKSAIKDVMLTNWMIWPAITFTNVYFIPIKYRVQVVNFAGMNWNLYLSWKSNRVKIQEEKRERALKKKMMADKIE